MNRYVCEDCRGDPLVGGLLHFATDICSATTGIYYWVDDHAHITSLVPFNAPHNLINSGYDSSKDPMHIENLAAQSSEIAFLGQADCANRQDFSHYLESYGLGDEVDLVFKHEGAIIGGLALFRPTSGRAFHTEAYGWESMRRYFETTLRYHSRVRSRAAEAKLNKMYGLSHREREVLDHLVTGASNIDIAEAMGISLATVKTHVVNIFDKLGAESRTAAVAVVLQLR